MQSRTIVWGIVATFPLVGVFDALYADPSDAFEPSTYPHALVVGVMCFFWCRSHARERGIAPPSGSVLLCALIPPLGIPAYLIRSRGWKSAMPGIGKAALAGVVAFALYYAAEAIAFHLAGR